MSNVDGGTILMITLGLLMVESFILLVFLAVNKYLYKRTLTRFFGILIIGSACSLLPFGPIGLMFGFPAILASSILVTLFLDSQMTY